MNRKLFPKILFIAIIILVCSGVKLYSQNTKSIAGSNNQFAFELYSQHKSQEDNIFFSPYSMYSALGMTYEGAKGETAKEMESVFHFPVEGSLRRVAFLEFNKQINKKDKKYELHVANALWVQEDYKFLDSYLNSVGKYYKAKIFNVNFAASEETRIRINNWIEDETSKKIKDLIPEGMISEMTTLVLTNAIYFKGFWFKKFDKSLTSEMDFKLCSGTKIRAKMMHLENKEADFNYMETDKFQMLELPYSGQELSMIIILPKNDDLSSVEEIINAKNLNLWQKELKREEIDIYLPRFKFETKYFMKDTLKIIGMPAAFSSSADFSVMTGKKGLFISDVIHQAFVEVNEEGTEAAAATAVVMPRWSYNQEIKSFTANHPFIFIIQEKSTGAILFLGRVSNPNVN